MLGLSPIKLYLLLYKSTINYEKYLRLHGYAYLHDEVIGAKGFIG